ncbi:carbohydrate sulfotransferase 9-like [Ptychodera flava]|uniref:carbohydrate sulfotransferase 9-like n=1 Tax=Ptychodera flava TaxID=63121 RepID=UPI003969D8A6
MDKAAVEIRNAVSSYFQDGRHSASSVQTRSATSSAAASLSPETLKSLIKECLQDLELKIRVMACKRTHVYLLLLLCVTLPVSWIFSRLLVSGDVKNLYNAWKTCNISLLPMDTRMIESRDRQNGLVVLPSHMKDKDKADINEKRKHVLQKLCHAIGRKNSGRGIILYHDQYKLLYCSVPKVACTSWRRVWLVLMGLEKSTNGIHHSVVHGKYGGFYPSLNKLNNREKAKRTESYLKFMFVRHPFGRLLSAYRNKFEVFEQRTSRAFLPKYGPQIIPGYRFNSSLSMRLSGEKTASNSRTSSAISSTQPILHNSMNIGDPWTSSAPFAA